MTVAAIIVTYNGKEWIDKCIKSLINSKHAVSIIVIDNGSTDGTQQALQALGVNYIQAQQNLGFAKANNIGFELAVKQNANFVFLLNQDAWITENTIENLIKVAVSNPEYGIVSPIHLNGTGTALDIKFANYLTPQNCKNYISDSSLNIVKDVYEIGFVNAAAWLISAGALKKTGFFDPVFFFYGEDNNYLQRLTFHHFKAGIVPACIAYHDREIRQGKLNITSEARWQRSQSLIILLNVTTSYKKSIKLFFKEKVRLIVHALFRLDFINITLQLKEIGFFLTNNFRLKKIRSKY